MGKIIGRNLVLACFVCFILVLIPSEAKAEEKFSKVITVTKSPYKAKKGKDCTEAIQAALDDATKKATSKKRVQVYIPSGTYYISKTLQIEIGRAHV